MSKDYEQAICRKGNRKNWYMKKCSKSLIETYKLEQQ